MNLTRSELAKLINEHVSGYRNCKGAEHLAELIVGADKEAYRDRFSIPWPDHDARPTY